MERISLGKASTERDREANKKDELLTPAQNIVETNQHANEKLIAIIGGGVGGLWLSYALASLGAQSVVIDTEPFASYASTRNQGWLQSGALYAALRETQTAEICRDGYAEMKSFVPGVVHEEVSAYALFKDAKALDSAVASCNDLNIAMKPVPIEDVIAEKPILVDSPFKAAARISDCPIDTNRVLTTLMQRASDLDVEFRTVKSLDTTDIKPTADGWKISDEGVDILDCSQVVLACGTYIPEMMKRLNIPTPDLTIWKITAMAINGDLSKSLLTTPGSDQGISLVPFDTEGVSGVTACFLRGHPSIETHRDSGLPDNYEEGHARRLAHNFPGIKTLVEDGNVFDAQFYTCQTLGTVDDHSTGKQGGSILRTYPHPSNPTSNMTVFYPRKFTSAPIAARECAERLLADSPTLPSLSGRGDHGVVPIAKQLYANKVTHRLVVKNDILSIQKI